MTATIEKLGSLATVAPGYQFRGGISHDPSGDASVIQIKDIRGSGEVDWSSLERVDASKVKEAYFAQADDVLFACRGSNNVSFHIDTQPPQVVVPNFFYIVRVNNGRVYPAFLNWYLHQRPARRQIERARRGTSISMISREGFSDIEIPLPPLERQKQIAELGKLIEKESELLAQLNQRKRELMESLLIEKTEFLAA